MRYWHGVLMTSMLLNCIGQGFAQETTLSLEQCFAYVLERNKDYQSTKLLIQTHQADMEKARADFYYPSVTGDIGYTHQGKIQNDLVVPPHQLHTSLSINKVLYSFGRLGDQLSIAEKRLGVAALEVQEKRNQIVLETAKAFYQLQLQKKSLAVLKTKNTTLKQSLEYEKRKYNQGKTTKLNYLRLQIEYLQDKTKLDQERIKLINAYNELYSNIGVQKIENLTELRYDIPQEFSKAQIDGYTHLDLQAFIQRAQSSRHDLLKLHKSLEILDLQASIQSTTYKPLVSAFAGLNHSWQTEIVGGKAGSTLVPRTLYNVGFKVEIPLLELINPKSSTRNAEQSIIHQKESTAERIKHIENLIEKEVRMKYLSLKEAERRVTRHKNMKALSRETFKISQRLYKAGTIAYLDHKDIEHTYNTAQLSYYQALHDYHINYLLLLHSVGVLLK